MAKKNSEYWRQRFEALENAQYDKSAAYYKDVQKQFRIATNNMQLDIEKWYQRLADNNGVSYAAAKKLLSKNELDEFHWSVEEYIKRGKENAINKSWMKQLENASAKVHISRLEAMKLQMQQHAELLFTQYEGGTGEFLNKSFQNAYYHTAYEIAKGTRVGTNLHRIDTRRINEVIRQPWAQDGANFSDRIWGNKEKLVNTLHNELTQNIIRGTSPQRAINNIAKTMEVSQSQAAALVMTENAAIASSAQEKCFSDLRIEEYEIVATLDSKTSQICQDLDGKHFPVKDYQVGLTAPPFHPRCRTTTVPYFEDEFVEGEERAARDSDGKSYYVDAGLNYHQWYDNYVAKEHQNDIIDMEQLKRSLSEQLQQLTEAEREALRSYTGFDAQRINQSIYSGKISDKIKDKITILDQALAKGVAVQDMVVHRLTILEHLNAFPKGYKPNELDMMLLMDGLLVNDAFMSTSLESIEFSRRNVEIILSIPKGYQGGLYIKDLAYHKFKDQEEFLLKRNVKYRVTEVNVKNGIYQLLAEVVE